jgi:replicative DNA helicase
MIKQKTMKEQKAEKNTKNYKKHTSPEDTQTIKPPPHDIQLEEAVLGAILIDKNAISAVSEILTPSSFYAEQNKLIYEAILSLFKRNLPIDILTVTSELRKNSKLEEVGGAFYVANITNKVASSVNLEYHSRILAEAQIKREIINLSGELQGDAFDDGQDVFDTLDKLQLRGYELASFGVRQDAKPVSTMVMDILDGISKRMYETVPTLSGIPSGFYEIDKITGGWQKTDMIIVAARPSIGKTAFVLKNVINASVYQNKASAIFSLEMSSAQLIMRMLSIISGIPGETLKGKPTNDEFMKIQNAASKIMAAPIYIDDTPSISIFEFRSKARRLKEVYNIEQIVIDYVQLMTPGSNAKNIGTREQEISHISRQIKGTAKELDIPIITLSQLSRAVEKRENKRPILSDLRESGSLEQDADIVAFLYRDEYYNDGGTNEEGESNEGKAELLIKKHRNGAIGDVQLFFDKTTTNFTGVMENFQLQSGYQQKKITPSAEPPKTFDSFDISDSIKNKDETPF